MPPTPHARAVNRVIDYITGHLDQPLTLDELASVAHMSPYHFHRTFTAEFGETPMKYLTRRRIEIAGHRLLQDRDQPVSNIAYMLGFSSMPVFCRTFKRHFGMTAEEFRHKNGEQQSKNGQSFGKTGQMPATHFSYLCSRQTIQTKGGKIMDCTFELRNQPEMKVIYARHKGEFHTIGEAFERLMQWSGPRGLLGPAMQTLAVYHDDPEVTSDENLLVSDACLVVPGEVKTEGDIGSYTITGGKYAVGRFEIGMNEFEQAWTSMCRLVAENGLKTAEGRHFYEMYLNDPQQHPEHKFIVDICIPVTPA